MKRFSKGTVLLGIITALLPFFFVGQAHAEETDPIYEKVKENGVLVVGLSADYAPYEFRANVDGKNEIVGIDISIAQKIADDLGVELKIEELGLTRC
jgi:polar amino acid transport system substrate-binding protein